MKKKPQLFLLHFAGGNGYSFQFMKKELEETFEFVPLELPGRGRRLGERILVNKDEAVQDYVKQIKEKRNQESFILFGHSMGASLGLNVTSELEKIGDAPSVFFAAGNAGPGVGTKKERFLMDDCQFKEELKALGGMPDELFTNEELFRFFNPIIRGDFELLERAFDVPVNLRIDTDIVAIMGSEEENVNELNNWSNYTEGNLKSEIFEGNHFFIFDHVQKLSQLIIENNDRTLVL
jgi:external thioesterase TEII